MKRYLSLILALAALFCLSSFALAETIETATGDWFVGEYVDDFGDPTGEKYIYTISEGTFSNTATSGSDLTVIVYYANDNFQIRLLEYNTTKATYLSSSEVVLKFKIDDTIYTHNLSASEAPNGDISVDDWTQKMVDMPSYAKSYVSLQLQIIANPRPFETSAFQQMMAFLAEGKDVRCVLTIGNSKYTFTVNASGFGDILYAADYSAASALMESGKYEEAMDAFAALGGYRDSHDRVRDCSRMINGPLVDAIEQIQSGNELTLGEAIAILDADPVYSEYDLSGAYMNMLRSYARCEGSFYMEGTSKTYEMALRFVMMYGQLKAVLTDTNYSDTMKKYADTELTGNGVIIIKTYGINSTHKNANVITYNVGANSTEVVWEGGSTYIYNRK